MFLDPSLHLDWLLVRSLVFEPRAGIGHIPLGTCACAMGATRRCVSTLVLVLLTLGLMPRLACWLRAWISRPWCADVLFVALLLGIVFETSLNRSCYDLVACRTTHALDCGSRCSKCGFNVTDAAQDASSITHMVQTPWW